MATPIIIAAMASNRVIGDSRTNNLPWPRQQDDMAFFRAKTMHNDILMGHKTLMSLRGIPLEGRNNYVMSTVTHPMIQGAYYYNSLTALQENLRWSGEMPFYIIGGASIFAQFLPTVNTMFITHFNFEAEGDILFPEFDESEWTREPVQELENGIIYQYTRINPIDLDAWQSEEVDEDEDWGDDEEDW